MATSKGGRPGDPKGSFLPDLMEANQSASTVQRESATRLSDCVHTGGGARNQFNPGLTQFSPNRGFRPTQVKPGFNPEGRLNLPTLYECQIWLQSDGRVEKGGGGYR